MHGCIIVIAVAVQEREAHDNDGDELEVGRAKREVSKSFLTCEG